MVPGMVERERLAHDARRAAWLAQAGSTAKLTTPGSSIRQEAGPASHRSRWRRLATVALALGRRLRPAFAPRHEPRPAALEATHR